MFSVLKGWLNGLVELIYPTTCLICRSAFTPSATISEQTFLRKDLLCPPCLETIKLNRPPFCSRCTRPFKYNPATLCRYCGKTDFAFDRVFCACHYDETMKHLLHLFKYGQQTGLKYPFTKKICEFLASYQIDLNGYLLVPVPLHPTRRRERGFNQAGLLAQELGRALALPVNDRSLKRIRYTNFQARLSRKERWTNIKGTFKISPTNNFISRNILIIDDLFTTGATLSEIAKEFKIMGAQNVSALTLAVAL